MSRLNDFRITLMRQNLGSALDTSDIAAQVGISRSRFFDDRGDPVERRLDWRQEALHICMRAVDNLFEVTGKQHQRVRELGYPVGNS